MRLLCSGMDLICFLSISLCLLGFSFGAEEGETSAGTEEKTGIACENDVLELECPVGSTIEVRGANYGRFSVFICNPEKRDWRNVMCMYPGTEARVQQRCTGRRDCKLPATNEAFEDHCPKVGKYLQVQYVCKAKPTEPPTETTRITTTTTVSTTSTTPAEWSEEKIGPTDASDETPDETDQSVRPNPRTTPPPGRPSTKFPGCPAVRARMIQWPLSGQPGLVMVPCPVGHKGGSGAYAMWGCLPSGEWDSKTPPDLSRCTSQRVLHLNHSVAMLSSQNQVKTTEIAKLLDESAVETVETGGELNTMAQVLDTLASEAERSLDGTKDIPAERKNTLVPHWARYFISKTATLVSSAQRESWDDLTSEGVKEVTGSRLLSGLEKVSDLVGHHTTERMQIASKDRSIVLQVDPVPPSSLSLLRFPTPVQGLGQAAEDYVLLPREVVTRSSDEPEAKVVVTRTKNLGQKLRIGPGQEVISEGILSVNVIHPVKTRQLAVPITVHMRTKMLSNASISKLRCVFWAASNHSTPEKSGGSWSSEGCSVASHNGSFTTCQCDHLSVFAVLMDTHGTPLRRDDKIALTFITYAGCTISILSLLIAFVVFVVFRPIRSERTVIHANLCLSLIIAEVLFLLAIERTENSVVCSVIAGLLHYWFLAAFAWMLIEGFQLYAMLVVIFESRYDRTRWFYPFGYGMPAIIVGISLAIDRHSYGTSQYCWLQTDNLFVLSFVIPVCVVLLANFGFLVMAMVIMYSAMHKSDFRGLSSKMDPARASRLVQARGWLKTCLVLMFLLGLTWAFGLLYMDSRHTVSFAYLFTIFNSLQGFFIFLFHVLLNDKVQKEWRRRARQSSWLPWCLRGPHADYSPAPVDAKGSSNTPLDTASTSNGSAEPPGKWFHQKKYSPRTSTQLLIGDTPTPTSANQRQMWHEALLDDPMESAHSNIIGVTETSGGSADSGCGTLSRGIYGASRGSPPEFRGHPIPPSYPPPSPPQLLSHSGGIQPGCYLTFNPDSADFAGVLTARPHGPAGFVDCAESPQMPSDREPPPNQLQHLLTLQHQPVYEESPYATAGVDNILHCCSHDSAGYGSEGEFPPRSSRGEPYFPGMSKHDMSSLQRSSVYADSQAPYYCSSVPRHPRPSTHRTPRHM